MIIKKGDIIRTKCMGAASVSEDVVSDIREDKKSGVTELQLNGLSYYNVEAVMKWMENATGKNEVKYNYLKEIEIK